MSVSQTLRVLVTERLTAAAEEIFALFERTIAEYEEENKRKQRLLDELYPTVLLPGAGVHIPPTSPGLGLDHKTTETAGIKEEQSIKQEEEEQLGVSVSTSNADCVKREEFSHLQTQEEDFSSEPHFLSKTQEHTHCSFDTDNHNNWERPTFSFSHARLETEANGDLYNQVKITDRSTAAQYSGLFLKYNSAGEMSAAVNTGGKTGTDERAERRKHQCSVCKKRFLSKLSLQIHTRVHTGERPYSCPICEMKIAQKGNLKIHMRTHTNEKPYSCSICGKAFARKDSLELHRRIHTGEKPYSCSLCNKNFYQGSNLKKHIKTHTKRNQT